ncbi:MAG: S-methyl-5-thioribose-1-phosphate isomerase [Gammaproteobacteria bacterium]
MKVQGVPYRSIWYDQKTEEVRIIDQRWLPHDFRLATLDSRKDFAVAIADMWVRGAPLIGATAAWGVAMEMRLRSDTDALNEVYEYLIKTRPTAVNLRWALDRCRNHLLPLAESDRAAAALALAHEVTEEDVETNRMIGVHGLEVIRTIAAGKPEGEPVRLLTHCNAGWLATVDWGTATSPMYHAANAGLNIHVWVDETRPRNQGALTAWELGSHDISHDYIVDNAGGHLMQHGLVDMVIVGTDRTTADGDVCNKIGTYLKALAAHDNGVPFYVGLPSPTIDWTAHVGVDDVPIEERDSEEISHVQGRDKDGSIATVQVTPERTGTGNPAFDITPGRLVTGLITERGISATGPGVLAQMFPDRAGN